MACDETLRRESRLFTLHLFLGLKPVLEEKVNQAQSQLTQELFPLINRHLVVAFSNSLYLCAAKQEHCRLQVVFCVAMLKHKTYISLILLNNDFHVCETSQVTFRLRAVLMYHKHVSKQRPQKSM